MSKKPPAMPKAKPTVTTTAAVATGAGNPLRVRATRLGFYRGNRVKPGMTFTLGRESDFAENWMSRVNGTVPDQLAEKLAEAQGTATRGRSAVVPRAGLEQTVDAGLVRETSDDQASESDDAPAVDNVLGD